MNIQKSFLKAFVWSVAVYGSETQTISPGDMRGREPFGDAINQTGK